LSVVSEFPIFQTSAILRAHSQLTIHNSLSQLYQPSTFFLQTFSQLVNLSTC
jgi:hypothetical protein